MSYRNMTIATAMRMIDDGELVLPAIQRDFVWSPERIYSFLDSLMRGYPFGTLLFWNTEQRVQYRRFITQAAPQARFRYFVKEEGQRGTMVLDGQQRLQSLYLALYGSLNGGSLYLDVLGGDGTADPSKARYRFEFLSSKTAAVRNSQSGSHQLWVPLSEIYQCKSRAERVLLTHRYLKQAGTVVTEDVGLRLDVNVDEVYSRLKAEEVLSYYTIDPNYGQDMGLTPTDEILEIFVRINSGGQVLSRSDLMFSLMQLHWEGAAESIDDLLAELNESGPGVFDFDKDFVLRCALVCCGKGARYSVDKLRDPATVAAIESAFHRIVRALRACVEFLINDARILDSRILGSNNTLIPFIYYIYRQEHQRFQSEAMRTDVSQALYFSLMTNLFSHYTDSRIDGCIREVLDPALQSSPVAFPREEFRVFADRRVGRAKIDNWLLQRNVRLLMNMLEGGVVLPTGRRRHRAEVDHIFPASKLRDHGYQQDEIDDFANYRLVSKRDNIWKSNQDPKPYFEDNPGVAERYLVPVELLDYDRYRDFLLVRRKRIWDRLQAFLGLADDDLPQEGRIVPGNENKVLDRFEEQIRALIDRVLSESLGEMYWKQTIPGQVQQGVKERIKAHLSLHPDQSWAEYASGRSRLDFCDVSDYETIVLSKGNWTHFEPIFVRQGEFERHLSAVRRFRNTVKHGRPIDEVERLGAEAGLLWFRRLLPQSEREDESNGDTSAQDGPTFEDYHRLLTRAPVPRGQRQLYRTLYDAGSDGLTREAIETAVGRSWRTISSALGALGRRINRTPGYCELKKPGIAMVFNWRRDAEGQWYLRMRSGMRDALERLNPDWLHEMAQ